MSRADRVREGLQIARQIAQALERSSKPMERVSTPARMIAAPALLRSAVKRKRTPGSLLVHSCGKEPP
jgi:hypothetical protein